MRKVDSHQHFWHYNPTKHQWINQQMAVLKQDFLPPQLADLLASKNIEGSIAVQADQSEAETEFLLKLADKFTFIKGVVGWIDLQSPELEQRLDYYSRFPKLKGFRHIVQDEPDDFFLLRDRFMNGVSKLAQYHYTYDILIYARQLPATLKFVNQFPEQPFVLDHIGKPNIKDDDWDAWADLIEELAQNSNLWCKVSGMVTEADWHQWSYTHLEKYLDHILQCFGPERIMFGSDWPVCLLAASYAQVVEVFDSFVNGLSAEAQLMMWGGNASSFYQL